MDNKKLTDSEQLKLALEELQQQLAYCCMHPEANITISFKRPEQPEVTIKLYDEASFTQHFLDAVDETLEELY